MYESDPTKHLKCYVSFDPAIDRKSMGKDFTTHFGTVGPLASDARYGTRDPLLIKTFADKTPCTFTLRPLRVYERAQCDSLPTAESKWLRALSYALVEADLHRPLATVSQATAPRNGDDGRPSFDGDALDWLAERVGIAVLYEIGAVALTRSKLGPFAGAFAPLPVLSVYEQEALFRSLADTHEPITSGT